MKKSQSKSKYLADLRKKAEKKLKKQTEKSRGLSAKDAQHLIHELRTHQIELEMQNEELRLAQEQIEATRSRYSDLYDFAPIGYLTLDRHGLIIESNLTGASLLGTERNSLIHKPFTGFIQRDDQDTFHIHLKEVFNTKTRRVCDVRLKRKDKSEFYAQLISTAVQDAEGNYNKIRTTVTDITGSKRAEEVLNQEKVKAQTYLNIAGVIIVVIDADLMVSLINKKGCEILGYDEKEIIGTNWFDTFIPEEEREQVKAVFKELMSGNIEPKEYFENVILTRKGDRKIIAWHNAVIRNKDGNIVSTLSSGEDITERHHAEEALQNAFSESRQRHAEIIALLEASRAVIEQREFKDTARSIFNSCKALIGATVGYVALLSADGAENEVLFLDSGGLPCTVDSTLPMPIRGLRETAYRTGKAVYENNFFKSKWVKFMPEGHTRLDNVLFAPLVIKKKAVGLLGLGNKPGGFSENDSRMASAFGELASIALYNSRLFELLINNEEKFRSVAQTATDAIITVDSTGKIIFWNKGAETTFGYLAVEVTGKPFIFIVPERFRESHQTGMNRMILKGVSKIIGKRFETIGVKKDGSEFPLELSLASWKTKEGIFFTSIIRDITERKNAEEELRNHRDHLDLLVKERTSALRKTNEELEQEIMDRKQAEAEAIRASQLASLGELSAGVAHEINNPVNGIINLAQMLLNKFDTESTEHAIADRIIKESLRIATIVKNLLSFARDGKEEKKSIHIHKIISHTLALTEMQLRKDGINLKVNISADTPEIIAHSQQIEQVFLNIISNARYALNQKYADAHNNKILEIMGEEITNDTVPYLRIIFHDRGTGIPSHILHKVMNPFFSTKPDEKGTGLGLSISHGIISDHGGRIKLESINGEYTKVFIDLPTGTQDNAG